MKMKILQSVPRPPIFYNLSEYNYDRLRKICEAFELGYQNSPEDYIEALYRLTMAADFDELLAALWEDPPPNSKDALHHKIRMLEQEKIGLQSELDGAKEQLEELRSLSQQEIDDKRAEIAHLRRRLELP